MEDLRTKLPVWNLYTRIYTSAPPDSDNASWEWFVAYKKRHMVPLNSTELIPDVRVAGQKCIPEATLRIFGQWE